MAVFLNGGEPDYLGASFTNGSELLSLFQSTLTQGGWTVIADEIAAGRLFVNGETTNGHRCFMSFVADDAAGMLTIHGALNNDDTQTSIDYSYSYGVGVDNRLWLSAEQDAGCFCLKNADNSFNSLHFGFLQRYSELDVYAWMVGVLDYRFNNAYWAKSYRKQASWRQVGADYEDADVMTLDDNCAPYQGTFDKYTVSVNPYDYYEVTSSKNMGYRAYQGSLNGVDGKPVLGDFYYIEGEYFRTETPAKLYFRGTVQLAITGVASIYKGGQVVDKNGYRYLSCGDRGVQGFRIA